MLSLMSFYNISPIFIQNIFVTAKGRLDKSQRYGKYYKEEIAFLKKHGDNIDDNVLLNKLKNFINFTEKNSGYYKKKYSNQNFAEIEKITDFKKMPILRKDELRKNIKDITTLQAKKGILSSTSGTTGTSMYVIYSKKDFQKRMAYLDYFKYKHGFLSLKMKRASFNTAKIVPPNTKKKVFWRDNLTIKQRIYSGYHCKGENLEYFINNLNEYQPHSIDGLPSSMYELARYINKYNIEISFRPIAIFPTAETLLPHYKKEIEKAFKCPVRNQYASSEGAPFVTECGSGELHYNRYTGIIENLSDSKILVTSFTTHGTPLIRYDIGDEMIFSDKTSCSCGSTDPIIKEIRGRNNDYLLSFNKEKVTSIYLSLVSESFSNSIKKMQFVQYNFDEIVVNIEADVSFKEEMKEIIISKLQYSFGIQMNIKIIVCEEIPKENSGKFRFIINNLNI